MFHDFFRDFFNEIFFTNFFRAFFHEILFTNFFSWLFSWNIIHDFLSGNIIQDFFREIFIANFSWNCFTFFCQEILFKIFFVKYLSRFLLRNIIVDFFANFRLSITFFPDISFTIFCQKILDFFSVKYLSLI